MKLAFLGAAHQVTGSCFLLEACGKKILIDCGMEQGPDIFDYQEIKIAAPEVDFVFLTHAHIDHSGMLPLLDKQGFKGEVVTTEATASLCSIMLRDSAFIQMHEAEWKNHRAERAGGGKIEPIYNVDDANSVISKFRGKHYGILYDITEGIKVRFSDAGHLLGSAIIELFVKEGEVEKKIVFSGDLGNIEQPLLNNPAVIEEADYVVIESTYGDRIHEKTIETIDDFARIINNTFLRGGKVIIPSFAVGRTQELLYFLRQIKQQKLVKQNPNFTVYVDSPLAIEATNIFKNVGKEYYDQEVKDLLAGGVNPISFQGLEVTVTSDESKAINESSESCVIISASGMCEAGRIRHHLKHNLWSEKNTILFVGYQVVGTLGFSILSGTRKVKLFQEVVNVNANIKKLHNTSAHADKDGLLRWISALKKKPEKVFVVHGEDRVCEMFAQTLRSELHLEAIAPYFGEEFDLEFGGVKVKNGTKRERLVPKSVLQRNRSISYTNLLAALSKLTELVQGCEGRANRDLEKFTKQMEEMTKRWD
ncbi:MAG: MBL fold metallo-hydrolase [Clostridia bacterium]|nr:MBL fold metallo-hydrolase [Clostridia bacterium]